MKIKYKISYYTRRVKYCVIYHVNKILGKDYPCGRTKKDWYLCCTRPMNDKTSYLSEDGHEVYCKYCNSLKAMSSRSEKDIESFFRW